jgi:hypothetical protein
MNYAITCIMLHLIGMIIGLLLIKGRPTPARWNLGHPKITSLKGSGKVRWIPLS